MPDANLEATEVIAEHTTSAKIPTHSHDMNHCIHLFDTMPSELVVARAPVERLNFQPRFTAPPGPTIASRRANILTLSVNVLTPIRFSNDYAVGCRGYSEYRQGTWRFTLQDFDEQCLLAVLCEEKLGAL